MKIPQQLLQINPMPKIPVCKMQSCVANYILQLWQTASNYKDNIIAIRKLNGRQ